VADYCAWTDAQGLLPKGTILSEESYPTKGTVDTFCTQVTNTVNVAFSGVGVLMPITDVDQLGRLKLACAKEVAYMVMVVRATNKEKNLEPFWESYHQDFVDLLTFIQEGNWPVTSTAASANLPSSRTMDAEGDETTAGIQPTMTTTKEF